jgi:hypothetical protein
LRADEPPVEVYPAVLGNKDSDGCTGVHRLQAKAGASDETGAWERLQEQA